MSVMDLASAAQMTKWLAQLHSRLKENIVADVSHSA
jgi:hypothetical protein